MNWIKYYLTHTIIIQGKWFQMNEIANKYMKRVFTINQDNKLSELLEVLVGLLYLEALKT